MIKTQIERASHLLLITPLSLDDANIIQVEAGEQREGGCGRCVWCSAASLTRSGKQDGGGTLIQQELIKVFLFCFFLSLLVCMEPSSRRFGDFFFLLLTFTEDKVTDP